ncbi:hypothetical protein JK361_37525 [Streptomyces sp. 5-8]|uniref:Uncharacterized protein n=1 Tax=Streptomyces musisoli TaxID=2802280 RepID=A0ABS1PCU0_9ACTN|nr:MULTISPECIES: hypothetical protein [Streptomyces]MBL1110192.1 hypothetical protein [Streptomyces musisoli]MBY8843301.1 hypothetical protein [Streptomyces sp. SP2-10]
MPAGRWGTGAGAVVVLAATGVWAMWPGQVDSRLWGEVRPVIEARLAAESRGSGYGEAVPALEAHWFCRAEALDLDDHGDEVRAGVNTLCVEYGVRDGSLVECSAGQAPQVLRLARTADGGYRVVSREQAPDGAGNARWTRDHFGRFAGSALDRPMSAGALESAARTRFGLPADAPVADC